MIPMWWVSAVTGMGSLDDRHFEWLVKELDAGQASDQLMIVAAHIPIGTDEPGGAVGWSSVAEVSEKKLVAKLHTYPNLDPLGGRPSPSGCGDGSRITRSRPSRTWLLGSRDVPRCAISPGVPHVRDCPQRRRHRLHLGDLRRPSSQGGFAGESARLLRGLAAALHHGPDRPAHCRSVQR